MTQAAETSQKIQTDAHLVLFSPLVMLAGQSMYVAATFAIYWFFKDVVPAEKLNLWSWVAVGGLSISIAFMVAFAIRRPGPEETVRLWRQIDKRLTHVFDLIAVCSIFLLFPHGEEKHRLVALAFIVGYGPSQLITDPENMWANRISVVTILSAFAIQLWLSGSPAALILTVLFILYGAMLIFAADTFRNAVTATVQREHATKAALEEVSKSRDAKTRFIANASHDLGQPLQAANLFARQLGQPELPAQQGLQQAIGQALGMVSHMLHYLRLESDSVQPNISSIDVSSLLRGVANLRSIEAKERNMQIKVFDSRLEAKADAALLQRAVDNLLGNALKHSEGSKVLLGAKSAGHSRLRVWVIDNGLGIAREEHEQVFEDYAQGSNAKIGGFGLGLSSVRRVATLMNGKAGFDPRWRKGCAAYIELARG